MSTPPAPRKRLPVHPSEENLRKQAKRLAKAHGLQLAAAQHRLAGEYGCRNWPELMHVVEVMNRGADQLRDVKRDHEPLPKAARARDMAAVRAILDAGAFTQHDLDAALAHAAWYGGDDPDVLRVRKALFDLLLDHGADPDGQYGSAYGPIIFGCGEGFELHGFQWLLDAGADVTAPPVQTKYGPQCVLSTWLGAYVRGPGTTAAKRRGVDILLARGAYVPPEVTPPVLAIHRGDADALAGLLDTDPDLARRRFPDMPYGNVPLRGATLLHLAVELADVACIDLLLARGADVNARATVGPDGFGGQTPIFHAISTMHSAGLPVLEHLIDRPGRWIDRDVAARVVVCSDPMPRAMTPPVFAEWAATDATPDYRRVTPRELALVRSLVGHAPGRNDG